MSGLCMIVTAIAFEDETVKNVPLQLRTDTCPTVPTLCLMDDTWQNSPFDNANTMLVRCFDKKGKLLFNGEASFPMHGV
jgi:hypothetical protein